MTLAPGDRLGPYEILALIGEGGMGEVYRARDTRLNRVVAVKVVSPILAGNPGFRERFEREAHTISQLNHPNICTLYDVGRQGGLSYFVMEFVEGETLAQRIGRGPLPLGDAVAIAHQIAQALASAHQLGIVHRDIKPANVMLTRSDFVKVLDFGLAKVEQPKEATASGIALGTLAYMAPERLLTDGHSRAGSDVWSLGTLLALEPRLRVAILHSAGFTYRRLPAEMDAVNYVSRIRIPVLMMTGRHDYVFPYQTSQKPLFDLIGTPSRDKRHVIYDAGHDPLPRSQVVREILSWLDRYLGASGKSVE